ncbi:MAG: DUF4418 family protein [Acidaminococcaceae bacterium]|nr:DUF4418 family protein [Acidaminococcaceae bacterium]MBR1662443.1 DUF4418 family protein [Acidaminococcaceae bacterium]MBR2183596.1 DUF4418 family protein [Acidaminococcaceae bacterium]
MNRKNSLSDYLLFMLSLLLCLGVQFLFPPCGPKADGSWMLCHWAGVFVSATGGIMIILNCARFFFKKLYCGWIHLGMIALSFLAIGLAGYAIPLCQMETMRCQAIFKPAVLLICILILLVTAADILWRRKE